MPVGHNSYWPQANNSYRLKADNSYMKATLLLSYNSFPAKGIPSQSDTLYHVAGERRKRCHSVAFAIGKSDLNESTETSSAKRSKRAMC